MLYVYGNERNENNNKYENQSSTEESCSKDRQFTLDTFLPLLTSPNQVGSSGSSRTGDGHDSTSQPRDPRDRSRRKGHSGRPMDSLPSIKENDFSVTQNMSAINLQHKRSHDRRKNKNQSYLDDWHLPKLETSRHIRRNVNRMTSAFDDMTLVNVNGSATAQQADGGQLSRDSNSPTSDLKSTLGDTKPLRRHRDTSNPKTKITKCGHSHTSPLDDLNRPNRKKNASGLDDVKQCRKKSNASAFDKAKPLNRIRHGSEFNDIDQLNSNNSASSTFDLKPTKFAFHASTLESGDVLKLNTSNTTTPTFRFNSKTFSFHASDFDDINELNSNNNNTSVSSDVQLNPLKFAYRRAPVSKDTKQQNINNNASATAMFLLPIPIATEVPTPAESVGVTGEATVEASSYPSTRASSEDGGHGGGPDVGLAGLTYLPYTFEIDGHNSVKGKVAREMIDFLHGVHDLLALTHTIKRKYLRSMTPLPNDVIREILQYSVNDKMGVRVRQFEMSLKEGSLGISDSVSNILSPKGSSVFAPKAKQSPMKTGQGNKKSCFVKSDPISKELNKIFGKSKKMPIWHAVVKDLIKFKETQAKLVEQIERGLPIEKHIRTRAPIINNLLKNDRFETRSMKTNPIELRYTGYQHAKHAGIKTSSKALEYQLDQLSAMYCGFESVEEHLEYLERQKPHWFTDLIKAVLQAEVLLTPEQTDAFEQLGRFYETNDKSIIFGQAKLCLVVQSLPTWDITREPTQKAVEFILREIFKVKHVPRMLRKWLLARRLPYVVLPPLPRRLSVGSAFCMN